MPKRTKAIKKTDIKGQKAWLRKKTSSKYLVEKVEQNKLILIVCEGQTEECYFMSFPVYGLDVKAINLQGQAKLQLVEGAQAIQKSADKKYDAVWCVFDMDIQKGEKEFADFDNAIEKAQSLPKFEVAHSNDCFELWFYLHFHYTDAKNHRTFYYQALSKIWGLNYEKDGKKRGFCEKLYQLMFAEDASQQDAIKRAKKLHLEQKDLLYHEQNPVTTVYRLVEFLNENLRR